MLFRERWIEWLPRRLFEWRAARWNGLRIEEKELQIRSTNSMRMYDPYSSQKDTASDWFATGDLVEIKDDRVYFAGRKSDMINVAGSKVYPVEVERVIRVIPGVADVRVFGKRSSIAGELVACELFRASMKTRMFEGQNRANMPRAIDDVSVTQNDQVC